MQPIRMNGVPTEEWKLGSQLDEKAKTSVIGDVKSVDPLCDPEHPIVITYQNITSAAYRIKDGVKYTPCTMSVISESTDMEIYLKKEFMQHTGSFKERGARYAIQMLTDEQREKGIIAASLGNHAQGVCYHGLQLGVPVTVVMPTVATLKKITMCKQLHANVVVQGDNMGEARAIAMNMAKKYGLTYINGYDNPYVIAGNGTVGLEIHEQVPDFDAVVIPVGGGGLLAGVAVTIKELRPHVKIIAVETEKTNSFSTALKNGAPTKTEIGETLADGLAVPCVGYNVFATVKNIVDKCIVVKEDWLAVAILKFIEHEKSIVEGAGAAGLAAVLAGQLDEFKGKRVVLCLSGGNMDTTILGRCIERGMAAEGRLIKLKVTISDRPGGIAEFCKHLASIGVSIKDILHERAWVLNDVFSVELAVVCETRDAEHAKEAINVLKETYKKVTYVNFPDLHSDKRAGSYAIAVADKTND